MWNKPGTDFPIKTPSSGRKSSPEMGGHGKLLIISGPSGSGKTSICRELEKDPRVRKSISVTTRPPRPQEQEGRDYYFVSEEEFKKRIEQEK
ncbi:MAG: guanylate kinase, partial [Candidatus Brocadiales bacterium]